MLKLQLKLKQQGLGTSRDPRQGGDNRSLVETSQVAATDINLAGAGDGILHAFTKITDNMMSRLESRLEARINDQIQRSEAADHTLNPAL